MKTYSIESRRYELYISITAGMHHFVVMSVVCVLNRPPACLMCTNHEVVVFQTRTLTATSLGSVTYN